jgi:hypothetical protein
MPIPGRSCLGIRESEISLFDFRGNALGRDFPQPSDLGFQRRDVLVALAESRCNIGGLEALRDVLRVFSFQAGTVKRITCSDRACKPSGISRAVSSVWFSTTRAPPPALDTAPAS